MHCSRKEEKRMKRKTHKLKSESKACWIILAILMLLCLLPMIMIVSSSLTDEQYIVQNGYSLFPKKTTLDTYIFLIGNKGKMLLKAFLITLIVTVLGTVYQVTITTLFAYAVTQKKEVFRFTCILSFFAWFTTIFGGGVVPWYILCTQYYGLQNNIWALFIPYGFNVFNMFILRSSFRGIPGELIESAKLDGASNSRIFIKIALPLARAGILTVSLFTIFGLWNDFYLPQWLTTKSDLQTLQKILYSMLTNVEQLLHNTQMSSYMDKIILPTQTAKLAVAVMAMIPLVVLYPFSLKYFVKGVNVGGVKG